MAAATEYLYKFIRQISGRVNPVSCAGKQNRMVFGAGLWGLRAAEDYSEVIDAA
jgi:hypothetical protein